MKTHAHTSAVMVESKHEPYGRGFRMELIVAWARRGRARGYKEEEGRGVQVLL